MQTPKLLASGTATINMTPMIDVVFLLIIFFLVSSHLAKQETSVKLDLPEAVSGLEEEPSDISTLIVNVLPDGKLRLGASEVNASNLRERFLQRVASSTQPIRLKVRTDRQVAYEFVEPVLKAASGAGIGDVVFSVYEQRTGKSGSGTNL